MYSNSSNKFFDNICSFNSPIKEAAIAEIVITKILMNKCDRKPVVLKENFLTVPAGIASPRNYYLFPALEEALQLTIPMGIPQHNKEVYDIHAYKLRDYVETIDDPKVLAFGDLDFGFVIWLAACGVSFCVFLCEILFYFSRVIFKRRNE